MNDRAVESRHPTGAPAALACNASPAPIAGLPDFWARVAAARHVALFLDYDGTLAQFQLDRMMARPLTGVVDALLGIIVASRTCLFIVSGRTTDEIVHLAGDLRLTIVGSHGWERRDAESAMTQIPVSAEQERLLSAAHAFAIGLLGAERVERKVASVAAHLRGLTTNAARAARERLTAQWLVDAGDDVVELRPFNGGLELRALGRHKGTAIRELLAELPPDTLAVYIGDDDTDEDAFRALAGRGIGIKVGDDGQPSFAQGRLPSCAAALELLLDWARVRAAAPTSA
jgi:trehalose 6-phosphate phosphatase